MLKIYQKEKKKKKKNHTLAATPTSASYIGISFLLTMMKQAVVAIINTLRELLMRIITIEITKQNEKLKILEEI